MQHKLEKGNVIKIPVIAREYYSTNFLEVKLDELYEFSCDPVQKWKDLFISCNADGFSNWLLLDKYKRLSGEKCFKLCGTFERNEHDHFAIGTKRKWKASKSGLVYFFANDHYKERCYGNNRGEITLVVKRFK